MLDDDVRETPGVVTGAVSLGTAPLPFLAVYAVLFLVHGSIHPVNPPDITSSTQGEFIAGCISVALFVVITMALLQFLNRRRRWLHALLQFGVLVTALDFVFDETKGGRFVSILLVLTTLISLVLSFAPASWTHVGRPVPGQVRRVYGSLGSDPTVTAAARNPGAPGHGSLSLPTSAPTTGVEPATLRRGRATPGPAPASGRHADLGGGQSG